MGAFKKPETNNTPLTHDFITKTAFIGIIGAVLGIERSEMKTKFPELSENLLYGVQVQNAVKKESWALTLRKAADLFDKAPKQMEFLKNPSFLVAVALRNPNSEKIFDDFISSVEQNEKLDKGERIFTFTAPTGSGKTMTLFALANEIIKRTSSHDVLYVLPFLSITEQVEIIADIQRLLEESDNNPEKLQELLRRVFSEETFDHPFIITIFVRFFETLVSNKNSELLKLPNFAKRIFLIDEVQALPTRLYIFFAALLNEFCRRCDSFAVLSTATMPFLEIENKIDSGQRTAKLFKNYPKFGEA